MSTLEVACFNEESALLAIEEKIDRIELCENYRLGGITPNVEVLQRLKDKTSIPIFVMIRARGGDFCYNEKELMQMKSDMLMLKKAGADGFVFGILDENQQLDIDRNKTLLNYADGLPCTFHRAFDRIENQEAALEQIISCGFKTILTSGGQATAMQGLDHLKNLKKRADGRINLLIGGGVRASNAGDLKTYFDHLHSACIQSGTENIDVNELQSLVKELL